jgi:RND family efflux transporter MFP subunit
MVSSPLLALRPEGGGARPEATPVRRPRVRWLTRVIVPAGILAGIGMVLLVAAWSALMPAVAVEVAPAVLKTVSTGAAGTVVVQAAGWIESDPYQVHVTALTSGVVEAVLVLEGDAVAAGQLLARLVPDDARLEHDRARVDLQLREAATAEAEARLAAAATAWSNPIERDLRVHAAAATVAELRARFDRTQAELARQQATLEQVERNSRRLQALGSAAVVSAADVEEAETALRAGRAALEALRHAVAETAALQERWSAELEAARQQRELRIEERRELDEAAAAVRRARAHQAAAAVTVAEAELRMARILIRAPRDGIVLSRYKDPGDRVMLSGDSERAATLFSLYAPSALQVRVDVPLADAAKVAVGQPCEIVCDVLPDQRFAGRVTRILHQADIQKNTLQVKAALDAPSAALRPEMLARVRFLAPARQAGAGAAAAVFVPADSLRDGCVWVVSGFDGRRGTAQARKVQAGREHDGWVEVDQVYPGDLVVRTAAAPLRSGQRVRLTRQQDKP